MCNRYFGLRVSVSAELSFINSPAASKFLLDVQPVSRARILLVEDEKFLRDVIRRVLLDKGYEVFTSRDASEALRQFWGLDGKIDLLITDVILPGRNGARLAAELSKKKPALKIVLISGYPERMVRHCQRHTTPTLFYLPKPFTTEVLTGKIHEVLNHGR